ncbi:unnamed protein product, partial [marine sediment metagenome]
METAILKELITDFLRSRYYKNHELSPNKNNRVLLVNTDDLEENNFNKTDGKYVSADCVKIEYLIRKNDIILAPLTPSSNNIEKVFFFNQEPECKMTISNNKNIIRVDETRINPGYLANVLNSSLFKQYLYPY